MKRVLSVLLICVMLVGVIAIVPTASAESIGDTSTYNGHISFWFPHVLNISSNNWDYGYCSVLFDGASCINGVGNSNARYMKMGNNLRIDGWTFYRQNDFGDYCRMQFSCSIKLNSSVDNIQNLQLTIDYYDDGTAGGSIYSGYTYIGYAKGLTTSTATSFSDLPDDSCSKWTLSEARERGIMAGVGNNMCSPFQSITRADIVTMLYAAMGRPETNANIPFTDVPENSYYYKPVCWAYSNGYTAGTSATTFSPKMTCTREQMATFAFRLSGCKGVGDSETWHVDGKKGTAHWMSLVRDVSPSNYSYRAFCWLLSETPFYGQHMEYNGFQFPGHPGAENITVLGRKDPCERLFAAFCILAALDYRNARE